MRKVILLAIFIFKILNCFGQNKNIDSLLTLLKKDKPDTIKVIHSNKLSGEYQNIGRYDSALSQANKALQLAQQLNYKNGIATSYNRIGIVYYQEADYPQTLEYYFKALNIFEGLMNKKGILFALNNIGLVYWKQSDYPKALEYDFKALKIAEELDNKLGITTIMDNVGSVYYSQKNYPKALDYYFKALKMADSNGSKSSIAFNLTNIGAFYGNQKNYSKAIDYYTKALKMEEELGDKNLIAINIGNIGLLYSKTGKFKEAELYLKKAIAIDDSIDAMDYLSNYEEVLSKLYDTTGRSKLALVHYKKAIALKDTIFSQENRKQLVRKEMNYEFDKKTDAIKAENEKQKAIAEEKNRQQKIIIWSVLVGLLLVVVFSGFIFRSLRMARKQKNTIELQKNEVSKQKEAADNQRIIAEGLREVSEKQKELVEEKQKEIIQSITYAKRIQTALLTSDGYIKEHLPAEHFVLFKPKDIVSGDFYWAISIAPFPGWDMGSNKIKLPSTTKKQNIFYMMTADCTGHGVPGAFMSMLNISYLHENIVERGIRLPHDILNSQRKEIIQALNPVGSTEESKDGMDCSLCVYDFDKMLLHFAAANNPLWLLRNQELIEYKADKMPVGKYSEKMASFTIQTIALQKGDVIYTSTDGFADQFGVTGKKLMKKKMKEELLKIHQLPMNEQKEYLNHFFESWKGNHEQVDDVLVIGVKI